MIRGIGFTPTGGTYSYEQKPRSKEQISMQEGIGEANAHRIKAYLFAECNNTAEINEWEGNAQPDDEQNDHRSKGNSSTRSRRPHKEVDEEEDCE